jgi:two-component system alkaline phosphatase synthesis response regulator PhoP
VDDDQDILELLSYNLGKEGYDVLTLHESMSAMPVAKAFLPDLIILDIMMPGLNGIELCRKLRSKERFKHTYIFFLTARSENYYQDAALNTGGDDYIEKIVGLKALTKRIGAVLKRNFKIHKSTALFKVGDLLINRRSCSVSLNGNEISLSKPEFDVLFFFAQNPTKTITIENLVQSIWGSDTYVADAHEEVYIQRLKRKLGDDIIFQKKKDHYLFKML